MKKIFFVLSLLSLSGCATVFTGSTQTISIKVEDNASKDALTGVSCNVTDSHGGHYVLSSNPGVITVTKGNGPLTVLCKKPGYQQVNTSVGDSFNGATLVNVIFWPGFLVDGASGAYRKYPSHYVVAMEKTPISTK